MNKKIILTNINKNEAARYLGYKDSLPDVAITKLILECEAELLKIIDPKYLYRVFDIEEKDNGILVSGTNLLLKGNSIREHLKGCTKAALMCTTLSSEVDKLLRVTEVSAMINTLIIDALSNAAIEQVCDNVEEFIANDVPEYNLTWRFGIGYGDLPLDTQKLFLDTINAPKLIGVCSNESYILTPMKSVTCIIGLSKNTLANNIDNNHRSCENCTIKNTCQFRKNNTTCHN